MHIDPTIKIEYNPITAFNRFRVNQIGTDTFQTFEDLPEDIELSQCVLVSDEGSLAAAITATTEDKPYVLIDEDGDRFEDISACTFDNLIAVYQEEGLTARLCTRTLDFTPANDNSIFVSKDGSDDTGDGTMENPVLTINHAITLCDATHQGVGIMDSGTYVEKAFKFTANFILIFAIIGCAPTIDVEPDPANITFPQELAETTLIVSNTTLSVPITLQSGNCMMLYAVSTELYPRYYVLNDAGTIITGSTLLFSVEINDLTGTQLSNGNIVVIYRKTSTAARLYYRVYSSAFTEVVSETALPDMAGAYVDVTELSNGKIFIVCNNSGASSIGYYMILNSDFSASVGWTALTAAAATYMNCNNVDEMNGILITFRRTDDNYGHYIMLSNDDYSVLKADTTIRANSTWGTSGCAIPGVGFALFFCDNSDGDKGKWIVYNYDYSEHTSITTFNAQQTLNTHTTMLESGKILFFYQEWISLFNYSAKYQIFNPISFLLEADEDTQINGVHLTSSSNNYYLAKFIYSTSDLSMKWSLINYISSYTSNRQCAVISSDSALTIQNSQIHDNEVGPVVANNTVSIKQSQFYRNSKGFALDIDGAGSGIEIDHCDFFSNYGALRLQNNDGDEVIKNSIFHNNANGLVADTEVELSHSVAVDALVNILIGTKVVRSNPHYVNETLPDLNLKTTLAGDPVTSPAFLLAESDKNAGAIDVRYLSSVTLWSSITIAKPLQPNREINPVGAVASTRKDGSVVSSVDAYSESLDFVYQGMINADFAKVMLLLACKKSQTRLYLNPETYPYEYELWTLLYDKVNKSAKHYRLTRTGVGPFTLSFARGFEP